MTGIRATFRACCGAYLLAGGSLHLHFNLTVLFIIARGKGGPANDSERGDRGQGERKQLNKEIPSYGQSS